MYLEVYPKYPRLMSQFKVGLPHYIFYKYGRGEYSTLCTIFFDILSVSAFV